MTQKTVSFCFDDGFLESTRKIASLFEDRGLRASFCVMAAPTESVDIAHRGAQFADWDMWRALRARGHDVGPHGWAHERLSTMPSKAAKQSLRRMFERFEAELPGFLSAETIFHTPYLALPHEILMWLTAQVAAVRVATGGHGITSHAAVRASRVIDCITFGPEAVADQAARHIDQFGTTDGELLTLVLHGVDGEGWGSLALGDLARLVDDCLARGHAIRPLIDTCRFLDCSSPGRSSLDRPSDS